MKNPKTILLENNGLLTTDCAKWMDSIDNQYLEINSEVRSYMRRDDLFLFAMFINPNLKTIATSSGFPTQMPYEAVISFGKNDNNDSEFQFTQLDYFSWLIYESVNFRKKNGTQPLDIYINYKGVDFLDDLKDGDFGQDTINYMKLMLRHFEGHVSIYLHGDYKLIKTIKTEEDLNLND